MDRPIIRALRRIVVAAGCGCFAAAAARADPWPIRNFQVVEMPVEEIADDTGGVVNDAIDAVVGVYSDDVAGDPARAEQREAIERYLRDCAEQLEAWGFPPPKLGRVVELENGELAYRVYSVASGGSSKYVPSAGGDGANAGHMRVNLAAGDLSRTLDFQGYATIAHELFHAVQYNSRFFNDDPGGVGDWITEGQAEAIGGDLAWRLAPGDASRAEMEWGRRDYARPLAIARRNPGGVGPPYDTASFWRYLAERGHINLTAGPTVRPGIADPAGAVHYGYLASLLSNPPQPRDCRTNDDRCPLEIQWLNAGLLGFDDIQQPLRKVFAEFAVTVAAFGDPGGRAQAENDASPLGADSWRGDVLDCIKTTVDGPIQEHRTTLRLRGVSARCIVVPEFFKNESEVFVEARATKSELLDQVVFGLAGDPKSATPMLTDDARARAETTTVWPVRLTPGRDNVLVFANVALDAPKTEDQELEIIISAEHASMDVGANGGPPSADIGAPLPVEFDLITPFVIRPPAELRGQTYIATKIGEGQAEPCYLNITLVNTTTRDMAGILLFTSGAITPGDYAFAPDPAEFTNPEDTPGEPHGGFILGSESLPDVEFRETFRVLDGVLSIDSLTNNVLRATATMHGVAERWDSEAEREVIDHEIAIAVQIAAQVGSQGQPPPDASEPYACFAGE